MDKSLGCFTRSIAKVSFLRSLILFPIALNILEMQTLMHELALNSLVLKKQRYVLIVIRD